MKKLPIWIPLVCGALLLAAIGILIAGYFRGRALREDLAKNGWDVAEYRAMADEHAHKWHADAVLDTLRADQVDAKGHSYLGPADHFDLRYRSPSATDKCALELVIIDRSPALTASIVDGACTPAPVPPVHCSIAEVLSRVLARGGRPDAKANISLAHGAWHVEQQDLRFDFVDDCK